MIVEAKRQTKDIIYPDSDAKPMADNTLQFRWIVTIEGGLDALFADRPDVFVAGDLLWYPVDVPKGEQSKVVSEALRNELARIRFKKVLQTSFGAWKAERHPELTKGTQRFIRSLRKSARPGRLAAR